MVLGQALEAGTCLKLYQVPWRMGVGLAHALGPDRRTPVPGRDSTLDVDGRAWWNHTSYFYIFHAPDADKPSGLAQNEPGSGVRLESALPLLAEMGRLGRAES